MSADPGRDRRIVAGRYALTGVLGRGGMGVVWLADDQMLQRQVALKEMTFSVDLTDEERGILRERTLREARAAARLDHPNVTRLYDVVEEDGKPWLVMEHVSSRSLQQILEHHGPLDPAAVARIGLDLLAALNAAHQAGIVHRDVKPSNVLVDSAGGACLTDFGIATATGDSSLTTGGALLGSPSYMAPERAQGEEPGPPVDLWSLGATLYAAVEGRPPFDRGDAMATLLSAVSDQPAPMLRAGPLEPVLQGLLTKDPAQRSTADHVRRQLQAVASDAASAPAGRSTADPSPAGQPPDGRPAAEPPPPQQEAAPAGRLRSDSVTRFDADDLLALASASKKVLKSVARDARDEARHMADKHREKKKREHAPARAGRGADALPDRPAGREPRRFRFKRRWVVVPVLVTFLVVVLVLGGLAWLLAAAFGLL